MYSASSASSVSCNDKALFLATNVFGFGFGVFCLLFVVYLLFSRSRQGSFDVTLMAPDPFGNRTHKGPSAQIVDNLCPVGFCMGN